ncbi:MAG: DUF167 family protein [Rugosibacter sp.]|jgi:hypothetical protein|nr:uncharacterized protein [Rugosibacter sp.]
MDWLQADAEGVKLRLHIQPGAKKTAVAGFHGDALKIRLHAQPVDGQANATLIAFLAQRLGVAKAAVTILSGASSRAKRVQVAGVSLATALAQLAAAE